MKYCAAKLKNVCKHCLIGESQTLRLFVNWLSRHASGATAFGHFGRL